MERDVIVETGPLVAYLNGRDGWHEWAVARLSEIEAPLATGEPVLTEAAYLLRADARGSDALMDMLDRGLLVLRFRLDDEVEHVRRLMKRYADVPMSLADACLVRMTEARRHAKLLTLDSDFRRYRRLGRQVIPLIAPR